jgi:hypothetical protein
MYYSNGDKYTGNFKRGKCHGKGKINRSGKTIRGIWDQGQFFKDKKEYRLVKAGLYEKVSYDPFWG